MILNFPLLNPNRTNVDYSVFEIFFKYNAFGSNEEVIDYFGLLHLIDRFHILEKLVNSYPSNKELLFEYIPLLYYYKGEYNVELYLNDLLELDYINQRDIFFLTYNHQKNSQENFYKPSNPSFICYATKYCDVLIKNLESPPHTQQCEQFIELIINFMSRST